MTAEQQREERRLQLAADFSKVADWFGFDSDYRAMIWEMIEWDMAHRRDGRIRLCYRQIAASFRSMA